MNFHRINCIPYLLLLVLFQFILFIPAFSQNGYSRIIDGVGSSKLDLDDIIYSEDQIFIRGNIYVDSIERWALFVAALDTNGIVLWQNTISDTITNSHLLADSPNRFIRLNDGSFELSADFYSIDKLGLIQLDRTGSLVHSNTYPYDGFGVYPKSVAFYEQHFYIIGQIQKFDYTMDIFVIKTDSTGKMIWNRNIGASTFDERFFGDVLNNQDGTFTVSAVRYSLNYIDHVDQGWMAPWIVTIDTAAQIIDQWLGQQNDNRTRGGGPTIHLDSGEWIIGSTEHKMGMDSMFGIVLNGPTVTKLRANKNIIWKKYLTDYVLPLDVLWDAAYDETRKELILVGEKVIQLTASKGAHEGWIIKLNDNGEVLWSRIDTMLDRADYVIKHQLVGIDISPSGSGYICGTVEDNYNYYGWVLKVTPDGCIDTLCTTTSILNQLYLSDKFSLYPNPAQEVVTVKTSVGFTSLRILDVSGKVRITEDYFSDGFNHSIDVSNLNSGMYLMQILDEKKQISMMKFIITD